MSGRQVALICELCGQEFIAKRSDARFCRSDECRRSAQRTRYNRWHSKPGSKEKRTSYQRRYRKATNYGRRYEVKSRYGLEWDEYVSLLDTYDHACAICGDPTDIVVDHCHTTGKVRGILCRKHNAGIGSLGDTADSVYKAYVYLKEREYGEVTP